MLFYSWQATLLTVVLVLSSLSIILACGAVEVKSLRLLRRKCKLYSMLFQPHECCLVLLCCAIGFGMIEDYCVENKKFSLVYANSRPELYISMLIYLLYRPELPKKRFLKNILLSDSET